MGKTTVIERHALDQLTNVQYMHMYCTRMCLEHILSVVGLLQKIMDGLQAMCMSVQKWCVHGVFVMIKDGIQGFLLELQPL